jgi:hypothetical protein
VSLAYLSYLDDWGIAQWLRNGQSMFADGVMNSLTKSTFHVPRQSEDCVNRCGCDKVLADTGFEIKLKVRECALKTEIPDQRSTML